MLATGVLASGRVAAEQGGLLATKKIALPRTVLQRSEKDSGLDLGRHAYELVARMNAAEREVARALAKSELVSWWWRNPENTGWCIVGPQGRFFPDFITKLSDGRLLVIEYKGGQLAGNPDTHAKEDAGRGWAQIAGPKASFYVVTDNPDPGRPAQISMDDLAQNVLKIAA